MRIFNRAQNIAKKTINKELSSTPNKKVKESAGQVRDSFMQVDASRRKMSASIGSLSPIRQAPLDVAKLQKDFGANIRSIPSSLFANITQQAFGEKSAQLDQNNIPQAANVRLANRASLHGADGAYSSKNGGTILLASDLSQEQRASTYREEAGHHLDALLGGPDSEGDEGAIFGRGIEAGNALKDARALKNTNDHGQVAIEGKQEKVEFRRPYDRALATQQASNTAQFMVQELDKYDRAWSAFTDGANTQFGSAHWSNLAGATNPTDAAEAGSVAFAMEFGRSQVRGSALTRLRGIAERNGLNAWQQENYALNVMQRAELTRDGAEAANHFSYLLNFSPPDYRP